VKQAFPILVPLTLIFWSAISVAEPPGSQASGLTSARSYYLNDVLQPHYYSPAKNSFLFKNLGRGQRRTILDLTGSGSVRHMWSTWSIPGDNSDTAPAGKVLLRVFIDGQLKPSIAGTVDEICRAAEATETRFVPLPAFNYRGAFNFYLPIFFRRGVRMEIEAVDDVDEFYAQIDYRLGPSDQSARLVSKRTRAGLILLYAGQSPPAFPQHQTPTPPTVQASQSLQYAPSGSAEFVIDGPGILRTLAFRGSGLPDLQLEIYWDNETRPSVQVPLQYFFADFVNAAMESKPGEMICYFPMPFRSKARILLRNPNQSRGQVAVEYAVEQGPLPRSTAYFHAEHHEMEKTPGYSQYSALTVRGKGLFIGINLFDTGHNHGGGDSALIDAGTAEPHMLHGICGEDYFSFAWHHTGAMTLLTGAPVHERRYRLHLENPYPFQESIQFLFGVFAGQHPRSVAFWYQAPEAAAQNEWLAFDIPWRVLGPLGTETALPDAVSEETYQTTVPIKDPTPLQERWQNAEMIAGFLDLTYQFRHYAMTESGTGYVAGESRTECITYIYSPTKKTVDALLGHDDAIIVRINDFTLPLLPERSGFGPSRLSLNLRAGWNKLSLALSNEENVDWRWSGVSLALRRNQSEALHFGADLPKTQLSPTETTQ